jgi:serine/threonine protein kinase
MGIEKLKSIWPGYKVLRSLGKGTYGKVYEVVHQDDENTFTAAVKVISIPSDDDELNQLKSDGLNDEQIKSHFEKIVNEFVTEIKIMYDLKDVTENIVKIEDHEIVQTSRGWEIFIRMELLKSFSAYLREKEELSPEETLDLAIDIASALDSCYKNNIIHRDIKPDNILVSEDGVYKLADFGIAKEISEDALENSHRGTYYYMAPEVAHIKGYDIRADIFSLGLILYKLLNDNRFPFMDLVQPIDIDGKKAALARRLSGEAIPPPIRAGHILGKVVLKCIAYEPEDRYQTPAELKKALVTLKDDEFIYSTAEFDNALLRMHFAEDETSALDQMEYDRLKEALKFDTLLREAGSLFDGALEMTLPDDMKLEDEPKLKDDFSLTETSGQLTTFTDTSLVPKDLDSNVLSLEENNSSEENEDDFFYYQKPKKSFTYKALIAVAVLVVVAIPSFILYNMFFNKSVQSLSIIDQLPDETGSSYIISPEDATSEEPGYEEDLNEPLDLVGEIDEQKVEDTSSSETEEIAPSGSDFTSELAAKQFADFYNSYVSALNAQDASLLTNCNSKVRSYMEGRFEVNKGFSFDLQSIELQKSSIKQVSEKEYQMTLRCKTKTKNKTSGKKSEAIAVWDVTVNADKAITKAVRRENSSKVKLKGEMIQIL